MSTTDRAPIIVKNWTDNIQEDQTWMFGFTTTSAADTIIVMCRSCGDKQLAIIGLGAHYITPTYRWQELPRDPYGNGYTELPAAVAAVCIHHLNETSAAKLSRQQVRQFLGTDAPDGDASSSLPEAIQQALNEAAQAGLSAAEAAHQASRARRNETNHQEARTRNMTTQYQAHDPTEENIFTDSVGRVNGLSETDWIIAFERWQENGDPDEPQDPFWVRIHDRDADLPMVDIKAQLEDSGWLFMTAYRGAELPGYDPSGDDPEEADENDSRPMVGRAAINIPLPPGWDDHQ